MDPTGKRDHTLLLRLENGLTGFLDDRDATGQILMGMLGVLYVVLAGRWLNREVVCRFVACRSH